MSKDNVNHPPHYTNHPSGIECVEITRHMGFNLGNAIKYIFRAESKNKEEEDYKKALWYINNEVEKYTKHFIEKWDVFPEDDRYEISTYGKVRMKGKPNRSLVPLKSGYLTFIVVKNKKHKCFYVHRAVAMTFLGGISENQCVCHINGDKSNNNVYNLRVDTYQSNTNDRRYHKTHYYGQNNPSSVLTIKDVQEIRSLKGLMSENEVASIYPVSRASIGRIWRGESWGDYRTNFMKTVDSVCLKEKRDNIAKAIELICFATWSKNIMEDLEKARWYINDEIKKREDVKK